MPRGQYQRGDRPVAGVPLEATDTEAPATFTRADEIRSNRRRRDDGDIDRMARMNLAIPRHVRDRAAAEGKVLRWINDTPGRLQQAYADDWSPVEDVAPVNAWREQEGKAYLHEKYDVLYEDDQRAKRTVLDDREESIRTGRGTGQAVPASQYNDELVRGNRIGRKPGA